MSPVKVLIVDDQSIARSFFENHVKASRNYEVVYSIASAEAAVGYCDAHPVDLVLMDVLMHYGMDGIEAASQIKHRHPQIRIILVTSMPEASWIDRARTIGVDSFWYKEYGDQPLLQVMDRTMAGESIYPEDSPPVRLGLAQRSDFTERELEVLREMTTGATNAEIAQRLNISVNTVNRHVQHLLEKTGYTSRTGLAVDARTLGLVIGKSQDFIP